MTKLQAEREENICRKDFTPKEAVEMARRIEAVERPKAKERQSSSLKQNASGRPEESSERTDKGNARDIVAAAVGMSHDRLRKATAVVDAAAKPDAPPEVKAAAEEMDRTGKVEPGKQRDCRQGQSPPAVSVP